MSRIWDQDTKRNVVRFIDAMSKEGYSKRECILAFSKIYNRSSSSTGRIYHENKEKLAQSNPMLTEDERTIVSTMTFPTLFSRIQQIDKKDTVHDDNEIEKLNKRISELYRENERYKGIINNLKLDITKELDEIRQTVAEQKKTFNVLDELLTEFASLRTIDAVTALRDYRDKFVIETDRFGTVIKRTDCSVENFEKQLAKAIKS